MDLNTSSCIIQHSFFSACLLLDGETDSAFYNSLFLNLLKHLLIELVDILPCFFWVLKIPLVYPLLVVSMSALIKLFVRFTYLSQLVENLIRIRCLKRQPSTYQSYKFKISKTWSFLHPSSSCYCFLP